MAIYRLSASVVKRSEGRSATAAAAYRAAMAVQDERTGLRFDYTRRRGVVHTEILAPADAPAWMSDRVQLWNAVERVEKRKDAQLAREIQLALPHELTHAQRLDLVRGFAGTEFVGRGMIADISVHAPDTRGDDRNWHAHILLTMRELAGEGFGKKARAWNDTEQLEHWRAAWAAAVNAMLEEHGHAGTVDHRSYIDRGIDREPEPKQGPVATELERQGLASYAGADRQAVQERNARREELVETLVATIAALDADAPEPPAPSPARAIPRPSWRRYLFQLWQTVARGITGPLLQRAPHRQRPNTGPIPK